MQKSAYFPDTNLKLYEFNNKYGFKGNIAINFQVLRILPCIKKYYYYTDYDKMLSEINKNKLEYILIVEWEKNKNKYVFYWIYREIKEKSIRYYLHRRKVISL